MVQCSSFFHIIVRSAYHSLYRSCMSQRIGNNAHWLVVQRTKPANAIGGTHRHGHDKRCLKASDVEALWWAHLNWCTFLWVRLKRMWAMREWRNECANKRTWPISKITLLSRLARYIQFFCICSTMFALNRSSSDSRCVFLCTQHTYTTELLSVLMNLATAERRTQNKYSPFWLTIFGLPGDVTKKTGTHCTELSRMSGMSRRPKRYWRE